MAGWSQFFQMDNIKARQAVDSPEILPDGSTVETRICIPKIA
jgi:hypothetical protein